MRPPGTTPDPAPAQEPPARIRLTPGTGAGSLDGGWWPRSCDATHELELLLAALPEVAGRVRRVSLATSDWPLPRPSRVRHANSWVRVGWFAHMEPRTVTLGNSSGGTRRVLLIVPADMGAEQAERALTLASTPTGQRATAILAAAAVPESRPPVAVAAAPAAPEATGGRAGARA